MIKNAMDVLEICEDQHIPIYQVALQDEVRRSGVSEAVILERMRTTYTEMKHSIAAGLEEDNDLHRIAGKMFNDDAKMILSYQEQRPALSGNTAATAVAYALSVMEVNCSMGRIVASPTAGSCGVLPAVLLSVSQTLELDDEAVVHSLFTAGMVGMIIGRNASLSGAQGGCQAEIGSAAAMAAAAAVEMAGGSPKQSFDAAAIALKNVMGLICDPVAGLVESPCVKRNGMGTVNALMCADMVLSGIPSIIPFDEVVWAMDKVGKSMPATLRETSEGGIAITPTAKRLKEEILNHE